MEFLRAIAHNIRVQGHATWLCARDPELDWPLRIFALAIAAYALSPIDLIPDFIPVLGMLDDAILLPLAVWLFRKAVPDAIFERNLRVAEAAATRPVSRGGAVAIAIIWLLLALWLAKLLGLIDLG
ncbi:YkvA family protein [Sphingorhabdus buctiana]|jgi:uncharacterized membrane protein YkvA (DUF1232 family)|uniref:YkvA family protein n=1 Tax=Sphingorhabdus buctiana TaxID=1508805 RepID=A0ABW4MIL3_9SPHN